MKLAFQSCLWQSPSNSLHYTYLKSLLGVFQLRWAPAWQCSCCLWHCDDVRSKGVFVVVSRVPLFYQRDHDGAWAKPHHCRTWLWRASQTAWTKTLLQLLSRPSHPLRCRLILLISSVMMAMGTPRAAAVDTVDPCLEFPQQACLVNVFLPTLYLLTGVGGCVPEMVGIVLLIWKKGTSWHPFTVRVPESLTQWFQFRTFLLVFLS